VHQRRLYVGFRYTFGGTTGNDAVRNAMQAAGINVDSPQAREAMRRAQEMQQAQAQAQAAAEAQKAAPAPAGTPAQTPPPAQK
jgi:membrane protease subunit (stomatin/prohibitin family)